VKLNDVAHRAAKLAADNSPAILTALSVTGAVTTAYLTGKASFRAAQILAEESPHLATKEKIDLTWRLYIPAVGTGLMTVGCIVAANRIGTRRAAAVAAAYTLSEKAFTEYREKIVEKLGDKKEQAFRDELAQDRVNRTPSATQQIVMVEGNSVLCFDAYTGRYFLSDMETLKKAQNDVNYKVLNEYYASLSDFYDKVGLPSTSMSDEVGWNSDRLLEVNFSTTLSDMSKPCIVLDFAVAPIRDYNRVH
jgi:hypothetical protein